MSKAARTNYGLAGSSVASARVEVAHAAALEHPPRLVIRVITRQFGGVGRKPFSYAKITA
jgi:hypothetical protein